MSNLNNVETLLKEHDLKVTTTRVKVLQILSVEKSVISYSDISKSLENEDIDRNTLYRTLQTFEEKGLIHKVLSPNNGIGYAICKHDTPEHNHEDNHVHFMCMECNNISCMDNIEIPPIKLPRNFTSKKYNFLIEGTCNVCNKIGKVN